MSSVPEIGNAPTTRRELALLQDVLEASTEHAIVVTDPEGAILLWNEGAARLLGRTASEIVGSPVAAMHAEDDVTADLPQWIRGRALRDGQWEGLVRQLHKDGSLVNTRMVATPRHDEGTHTGYLLISRRVSDEQLEMARELEEMKAYGDALLESAPDAMVIVTRDGDIRVANAQSEKLFGYSRGELVGQSVELLLPAQHHALHPAHRAEYFGEPRFRPMAAGLDLWARRKDGSEFPVEISLSPLETEQGLFATAAIRDVTERRQAADALQRANAHLEAANRAKDNFLASMSHELRTPLNAVLGFTGTMLMELPGPLNDEQRKQLRTVQSSGRHLLSLINDLLDLARIEAGKLTLSMEPVACRELLDEVARGLAPLAGDKGIALDVRYPEDEELEVVTDRRALSQILINLANNAIKFTDQGAVQLEVARTNGGAPATIFRIVDSGRGIRDSDQEKLYLAFEQIDASSAGIHEGTGLGLHICQRLAKLIGARLTLESEFGRGSAFTLELKG